MLKKELIKQLQNLPEDVDVVLYNSYDGMHESIESLVYSDRTAEIILMSFKN